MASANWFGQVVNAAHKMVRPAIVFTQLGFYWWCVAHGVTITPELVTGVSGVAASYVLMKGRGN